MIKISDIKEAVSINRVIWRHHSKVRMSQRSLTGQEVKEAILNGEIIEEYNNDKPFPSCLISGECNQKQIHVVLGFDFKERIAYIISIYKPDLNVFTDDFKTRRQIKE